MHHIRAVEYQLVRVDQEKQIPGVQLTAGAKVCSQPIAVFGLALPKQNHSL